MATKTAPWSGEAMTSSVDSYGITLEVDLYVAGRPLPYSLTASDVSVDYDAKRSPRVQASMRLAWPSAEVLALLDPRYLALTIEIRSGYRFLMTGREDTQTMARLRVQECEIDYAEQSVKISAASDECIPIGYPIDTAVTYTTTDSVVTRIQSLVNGALVGESPVWVIGENVRLVETFADTQVLTPGQDRWSLVADWADSIGCVVYHDGLGVWHIDKAMAMPLASTVANLRDGERGTIINLTTTNSRNGYGNRAAAVYEYAVGTANYRVTAIAKTSLTPCTMVSATQRFKPHNAVEVARQMLLRALRRGHTVEVQAASWLWVRPGFSVTASLSDGTHERLMVETASFDVTGGVMTLTGQNSDGIDYLDITTSITTSTL